MRVNPYQAFELEADLIKSGIWFDFIDPQGFLVCQIKCRPSDPELNPQFLEASVKLPSQQKPDEPPAKALAVIYAEAVVVDWRGVTDREGKPLECTPKNIVKVLADLPILFQQLRIKTRDWTLWRKNYTEAALGN